jgi:hypothetical protein
MRHASPAIRIRPTAMSLVLLAHVPLLLLFLWGWRLSRDEPEPTLIFIGLWPLMHAAENGSSARPAPVLPRRTAQRISAPVRDAPAPRLPMESSAITVPADSPAPPASPDPGIDWRAQAAGAAARQAAPAAPARFSAPPNVQRKACEKPRTSWEWNPEPKKAGITQIPYGVPLPYVVLGRCVVGLGYFGCSPQKPPEANSHLLDDMRDGKTSPSSVPDRDRCD